MDAGDGDRGGGTGATHEQAATVAALAGVSSGCLVEREQAVLLGQHASRWWLSNAVAGEGVAQFGSETL